MSRTRVRARVGATVRSAAIALLMVGAIAGCGGDGENSAQEPQDVITGTVLDDTGGAPMSGVAVELLVWPAPQAGATAPVGQSPELIRIDEDATAADGSFDLEALAADLSPHASSDGQVGVEIRKVGAAGAGMRMAVRLSRSEGTGEFMIQAVEGLEVTPKELGDS